MTVTEASSTAAPLQTVVETEESTIKCRTPVRPKLQKEPYQTIYRTNTFPRIKKKAKYSNEIVSLSPLSGQRYSLQQNLATNSTGQQYSGAFRDFKRGFSEQVQRIGRGTLDKLQKINRARRLAGMFRISMDNSNLNYYPLVAVGTCPLYIRVPSSLWHACNT